MHGVFKMPMLCRITLQYLLQGLNAMGYLRLYLWAISGYI